MPTMLSPVQIGKYVSYNLIVMSVCLMKIKPFSSYTKHGLHNFTQPGRQINYATTHALNYIWLLSEVNLKHR